MPKQKLMQTNRLKVASLVGNRVRFIDEDLNEFSNSSHLEKELLNSEEIINARVNKKAKSIIIEFNSSLDSVKKIVEGIKIRQEESEEVAVDKSGIWRSLFALGANYFLRNQNLMMLTTLYASYPILREGAGDFIKNGLTSKMLEALAVGVSIARNDYRAANATSLLLNIGEYIEESTVIKSDNLIKELAKPNVSKVWIEVEKEGKHQELLIDFEDLKVGDVVVVNAGDKIAVDGYVLDGVADVNQVSMTGEAEPVKKSRGDKVMSGTVLEEGRLKIWAESIGDETSTSRIKQYIQASLDEKSKIGLKATKLADSLVPVTLSLAALSYLINKDTMSMAAVLQADYSCALKLATPVAFKTNIANAGKDGILIKGASAIEALAKADTFVFDKTGTLTSGKLKVAEVNSFVDKFSDKDLLNLAASAEEHYFHPVAKAVVRAAKEQGFHHFHHDEVEFIVAHGVKTIIDDKEVLIGSRHFLEDDENISFKGHEDKIKESLKSGLALLYISYGGKLVGTIGMVDRIRESSKATISRLRELGAKEIVMITGDIEEKANEVAKELGIDRVYANCLPTGKAQIIEELKSSGRNVAFVGDGINDAPSLVKADVGISMKKGADIAVASADISLLKDDISSVAIAKEIANKTIVKIHNNFNATVIINTAILLGATFAMLDPIKTAFLHNGTTVGLLLNSLKGVDVDR